ncbi:uncharacterized protein LAESUDRAFT_306548 [Laetiporus sulphureus 93-53]|uniref:Uncharacterized protein n=1 Tax=Laetiporus sulphureus 93-53 TaxID=1314785 RepID=A0A165D942_9APHY|nr:uncharacterized protein LAESUDRAFT_306548 [Laetiporus sulphureus 93-53]KZT04362.1 hypothetical protein LAESUDRAFT_306548 [Laetiporus sulphureus 93-53]
MFKSRSPSHLATLHLPHLALRSMAHLSGAHYAYHQPLGDGRKAARRVPMQPLSRRRPENSTAGSTPYIRGNANLPPEPPSAPINLRNVKGDGTATRLPRNTWLDGLPSIDNTLMNLVLCRLMDEATSKSLSRLSYSPQS